MAYEQKDMSGSLFKNDRKTEAGHADRSGKGMIDGREYYINGWLKKDKKGDSYLSLSFKPVAQASRPARTAHAASAARVAADDDIPFSPEWR